MNRLESLRLAKELTGSTCLLDLMHSASLLRSYVVHDAQRTTVDSLDSVLSNIRINRPTGELVEYSPEGYLVKFMEGALDPNRIGPSYIVSGRRMGVSTALDVLAVYSSMAAPNRRTALVCGDSFVFTHHHMDGIEILVTQSVLPFDVNIAKRSKRSIQFTNGSSITPMTFRSVVGEAVKAEQEDRLYDQVIVDNAGFIPMSIQTNTVEAFSNLTGGKSPIWAGATSSPAAGTWASGWSENPDTIYANYRDCSFNNPADLERFRSRMGEENWAREYDIRHPTGV